MSRTFERPQPAPIVVLGGLNMDLMIETPLPAGPGETREGTRFYTTPGGKGGNQAVAAARLAGRSKTVRMVGKIGGDVFGTEMREFLEKEGIDTSYVAVEQGISSGIAAIFIDASGQNYVNAVYGANALCGQDQVAACGRALEDAAVLLVQQEIPLDATAGAMRRARQHGASVILDPAPTREIEWDYYDDVDILTPNQTEAEAVSGIAVTDVGSASRAASEIRKRGIPTAIITLGEDGAWVESADVSTHLPPHDVKAVATVGAGDAFNGGLAVGLASRMNIVDATRIAMATGALCTTKPGAQDAMPTWDEVSTLVNAG